MKQGKIKNYHPAEIKKHMLNNLVELQTQMLIEYAIDKIKEIGDKINTYNSRYHMDRTGNLLNSLCWGVAYSGELKASGFYREEVIHNDRGVDTKNHPGESFLHEFFEEDVWSSFPVKGRTLATNYISQYGKSSWSGRWRVFFAILAPYWGFWEKGFHSIKGNGRFIQFHVMTEFYDKVSKDLKPAKVNFKVTKSHHYSRYGFTDKKGKRHTFGSLERAISRRDKRERWD